MRKEIFICDLCKDTEVDYLGKLEMNVRGDTNIQIEICAKCEKKILETVRGLNKK